MVVKWNFFSTNCIPQFIIYSALVGTESFFNWEFYRYGEIVDVNLVRDKGTGKSKGFAFVAYEDQRSTNLAVGQYVHNHQILFSVCFLIITQLQCSSRFGLFSADNLNGAQILGRIIRVDHVSNYKKKEEEDEETERQKREARGVCRAFQRGECNRGAGCKFSHDEQVCFVVPADQHHFSSSI